MTEYKKILVPLDGSELAEKVLTTAVDLAESFSAELLLLRVREPLGHVMDTEMRAQLHRLRKDEIQAYMKRVMQSDVIHGRVKAEAKLMSGAVAETIIDCAQKSDVDLIMMSSHGRSGIGRWVYGSVAEKVLRQSPCATIILQAKADVPMFTHKHFLVTLDGSKLAEKAIDPLLPIARALSARVTFLRVTTMPYLGTEAIDPLVSKQNLDRIEERERMEAREYLQRVRNTLTDTGVPISIEVTSGPVAETILSYAEHQDVDLIAISSHGRSGVGRWFYGSVAEKVLRGAPCAMLVTRGHNDA